MPEVDAVTNGIQKATYYLVGADSNIGKTTFTDFYFVLCGWLRAKQENRPFKVFYYSLEVSRTKKIAKWVSFYIKIKHNVELPMDLMLGKIPSLKMTPEQLELVKEGYDFVYSMLADIAIIDKSTHPTAIFNTMVDFYSAYGTIERAAVTEADKKKNRKGKVIGFTPTMEVPITLLVIDHLSLLDEESNLTLKGTIDRMSKEAVVLRNLFETSPVFIQQFSTDLLSTKRESVARRGSKDAEGLITPTRLDFGDSKYTFRDADLVFGLVKPFQFDVSEYRMINTSSVLNGGLGDFFLLNYLIKNRDGAVGLDFPLFMNPIGNVFYDFPTEVGSEYPWYAEAARLSVIYEQLKQYKTNG